MPNTSNELTAERAAWLAAELQAVEQEAMEELRKKRASLWKAMEEVQQKAQEEEEARARAEAIRRAQEEPEPQGMSGIDFFFGAAKFAFPRVECERPPRGRQGLRA